MKNNLCFSLLAFVLAGGSLPAAVQYWDADGSAANNNVDGTGLGGTQNWSTALSYWWDGSSGSDAAWTEGNDAVFAGTAGTVTLSGPRTANSLSFRTGGYIITGSTLTNLSGLTLDVQTGTATIGPNLLGSQGYSKTGAGTAVLTNLANAISGPVTVNSGVLEITTSGRIGATTPGAGDITINGAVFRNDDTGAGNFLLTSNRSIIIGPSGGTINLPTSSQILIYEALISGPGNTLTVSGPGELRMRTNATYSGHNTFAKLVLNGAMFTMGQSVSPCAEDTLGAVPSVVTDDAITLMNGGRLRGNVTNNTLNINRGITLGTGGGGLRNVSAGQVLSIPSAIKGANALLIGGGTDGGIIAISNPANSFGDVTISNCILRVDAPGVFPDGSALTLWGGGFDLNGNTEAVGQVILGGGTIFGPGALTGAGSNYDVRKGTVSASLAGALGVTKTTGDTVTLSGTNSYTGVTSVSAGKLVTTTASAGAGSYVLADGATNGVKVASQGASLLVSDYTIGNARMEFDFADLGNPTAVILTNSGNIAVNGTVPIDVKNFTTNASGILIQYGSRTGAGSFTTGLLPPHSSGTITDDTANNRVLLSATADTLRWNGDASANWTLNDAANLTWRLAIGGTADYYQENAMQSDTVRFDDNASGSTDVNITATVAPKEVALTNSTLNYSFNGSGQIIGAATLTKDGNADLTVLGNVLNGSLRLVKNGTGTLTILSSNRFNGGTILNAGTLVMSNANAVGVTSTVGSGKVTVNGGRIRNDSATARTLSFPADLFGTLTVGDSVNGNLTLSGAWTLKGSNPEIDVDTINATFSGAIGEDAAGRPLTKGGTGTMSLTGANTFTGGFIHNAGTVRANNVTALGAANSPVTLANGTVLSTTTTTARTLTYDWTINGDITLGQASGGTARVTMAGTMDFGGGTRTFTLANSADTISAVIANGGLTLNSAGSLTLSGVNTYSGSTTVNAGALVLSATGTVGDGTGTLYLAGGSLQTSGGRASNPLPNPIVMTADTIMEGDTSGAGTREFPISGPFTTTAGTLIIKNTGTANGFWNPGFFMGGLNFTQPIVIGDGADPGGVWLTCNNTNGSADQIFSGTISGYGVFRRAAASGQTGGRTILTGDNSYAGGTVVTNGTLLVNNTTGSGTGSGAVNVSLKGVLGGTGTIVGPVIAASGGAIAPGASPGTLALQAGLDFSAGGVYAWQLGANSEAAGTFDQVALTGGSLVLGGTSKLAVDFTGTATSPNSGDPFWSSAHSWTIVALSGGAANPGNSDFAATANAVYTNGYFTTAVSGGNVVVNYTPGSTRPQITSISLSSGSPTIELSNTIKGASYILQYTDSFNPVAWNNLATVIGTGGGVSLSDPTTPLPAQRFYQIVVQ